MNTPRIEIRSHRLDTQRMYNTYCNPYGDWYERERHWGCSPSSPEREREREMERREREMEDAMDQEIIYYEQEIMNVSWEEERSKKLQRMYWQRRSKKEL
jgi:hypothetical protein